MAPINRRSFVKAFAGLACAALAMPRGFNPPQDIAKQFSAQPHMRIGFDSLGTHYETHDGARIEKMQSIDGELHVWSETTHYVLRERPRWLRCYGGELIG